MLSSQRSRDCLPNTQLSFSCTTLRQLLNMDSRSEPFEMANDLDFRKQKLLDMNI